ncbi:MAG TPA: Rv3235 family protein [Sporichthya sp.]|nr:Rv3235 family protein [Sporichthya sp.]
MTVAAAALSSPARGPYRLPTPATEPPYDEPAVPHLAGPHPAGPRPAGPIPTQGTLALTFPAPSGPVIPRPALRVVPEPALESPPSAAAGLPALKAWGETVAMAVAQILTGERTAAQFRHWAMPEVFDALSRRAALAAQAPRRRARLRAVHVCCPAPGVAEVCTVVHGLARPRALAFRLEARRTRWVCTVLELG